MFERKTFQLYCKYKDYVFNICKHETQTLSEYWENEW
jgi:hypothetical protein